MRADYLNYSAATHEEMDDRINGAQGMFFPWHEVVTILGQYPASAAVGAVNQVIEQPVTQELALVGRQVRDVLCVDSLTEDRGMASFSKGSVSLYGIYAAHCPIITPHTQVKVNDLNVYPRPLDTVSQKIAETENVFRAPLAVPRPLYTRMVNPVTGSYSMAIDNIPYAIGGLTSGNVLTQAMGTPQNCQGFNYLEGIPLLTNPLQGVGTTIIDKPILFTRDLQRTYYDQAGHTTRYFCSVSKAFSLRNGMVSVAV